MKHNNNNNNNMQAIMAQAMAQGNFADVMQGIMAQVMQAGMAQGIKAGMAQAMQAQAMGNGDAGKAQAWHMPAGMAQEQQAQAQGKHARQAQGKGKAQAQGKAIEYKACLRRDEKALIGSLRDALISDDAGKALSIIKAWHIMVNKDKTVQDAVIIALYRNLCKVAFDGKYATVKGTKQAQLVCKSCGRIKAWLYTWNRGDVKIIG